MIAAEPNLTTIGMHSLSPAPFSCNTLSCVGTKMQSLICSAACFDANPAS
jgi:hypothetical protein